MFHRPLTDQFQEGSEVIAYPRLEKNYSSFSVAIEPGLVRKGEILGNHGGKCTG